MLIHDCPLLCNYEKLWSPLDVDTKRRRRMQKGLLLNVKYNKLSSYSVFPNITTLTTIDIIFGAFLSKNELLSFIIIATKYYIHCCYWSNKSPNIASLKWKFKQYEIVERLNAIKIDKLRNHNVKWEKFTNMYGGMNV